MKPKSRTLANNGPAKPPAAPGKAAPASSPPEARAGTPPDPHVPSSYPRRILLAVTGLSPQVVTETLYALAADPNRAQDFVPTEIHLITTREGVERARLALLSEDPGWFRRLCRDYELGTIRFDTSCLHALTDGDGKPADDIRTLADNERAADFITEKVRDLTADADSALHVSIAGGRKTMGYYLGYALSLFGREQDRLSHVLVSEPFESSWDFFYPTPYPRVITTRDNKLVDTRDAEVTLAEIPFVRLRDELPERLMTGQARFTEAVEKANRAMHRPGLSIRLSPPGVLAEGEPVSLSPTELTLLLWLARRAVSGEPEVQWSSQEAVDEFLHCAEQVVGPHSGDYERMENALKWRKDSPKDIGEYFEPHKTRIKDAFKHALGKARAVRYEIKRTGPRGRSRYFLPLEAEQIEIRD